MIKSCKIVNMNSSKRVSNVGACDTIMQSSLEQVIQKLKLRIEREIPDKGYFRNFAENLDKEQKHRFWCKDIALFIERDEKCEGTAFLGVSVLHPTMAIESSRYFMKGDKKKILEYINQNNFSQELQNTILALSDNLKNDF